MELTVMNLSMSLRRILLTVCAVVCLSVGVSAQDIDIRLKDVTVQTAIMELQKKYGYSVVVKSTELDLSKVISVNLKDKDVKEVVAAIFEGQDADITITGKNIAVAKAKPADAVKNITVQGVIIDETGMPVIGAAVFQKGTVPMVSLPESTAITLSLCLLMPTLQYRASVTRMQVCLFAVMLL